MSFSILQQPIGELKMSDGFKEMAYCNDFRTIQDIIGVSSGVLLMHNGFTCHHYQELRNMLIKLNALHLLRTRPLQFA